MASLRKNETTGYVILSNEIVTKVVKVITSISIILALMACTPGKAQRQPLDPSGPVDAKEAAEYVSYLILGGEKSVTIKAVFPNTSKAQWGLPVIDRRPVTIAIRKEGKCDRVPKNYLGTVLHEVVDHSVFYYGEGTKVCDFLQLQIDQVIKDGRADAVVWLFEPVASADEVNRLVDSTSDRWRIHRFTADCAILQYRVPSGPTGMVRVVLTDHSSEPLATVTEDQAECLVRGIAIGMELRGAGEDPSIPMLSQFFPFSSCSEERPDPAHPCAIGFRDAEAIYYAAKFIGMAQQGLTPGGPWDRETLLKYLMDVKVNDTSPDYQMNLLARQMNGQRDRFRVLCSSQNDKNISSAMTAKSLSRSC